MLIRCDVQRYIGKFQPGLVVLIAVLGASACATTKVPKFSHIHIGHSLTGWVNTPSNKGLFVTTEKIADEIAGLSVSSTDALQKSDYETVRRNSRQIARRIGDDPRAEIKSADSYTFLTSFQGTVDHMRFALESDDASANLQDGVRKFLDNSVTIFARSNVLKALAEATVSETDPGVIKDLAWEIRILAVQNLEGEDVDNDGYKGNTSEEYGLRQLRADIASTISNEDPPYRAVEQRYLFGLVRLPDGTWAFKDPEAGGGSYGRYSY